MSTKEEEDGRKKRLMAAETPFVTNGLFNLKSFYPSCILSTSDSNSLSSLPLLIPFLFGAPLAFWDCEWLL
ncbi:uncharacterized [Tachysurus ichikawai]